MYTYASQSAATHLDMPPQPNYHSVEFALDTAYPVYQFKLWHPDRNSMFLLAKRNSAVLPELKEGRVLPMKYYSNDAVRTVEVHNTRIKKMVDETRGRFRGHWRIELSIIQGNGADN